MDETPISITVTTTDTTDYMRAPVQIYDPADPKGTMQRHFVSRNSPPVDVPAGWVVSTASVDPGCEVILTCAGKPIAPKP